MGSYDVVVITEVPSDGVATSVLLTLNSLGNVRTTTLRASPEKEARNLISSLPNAV